MSEIPDDIWTAVDVAMPDVFFRGVDVDHAKIAVRSAMAKALLAEREAQRERDAKIAAEVAAMHRKAMDHRGGSAIQGVVESIRRGEA